MTRPKRHLCVIGDSETVGKYALLVPPTTVPALIPKRGSKFLKRWMSFLEEHADLRYPNISDLDLG